MNPIYPSLNRVPSLFSLPWPFFAAVVVVAALLMLPLTEIFGLVGLLCSFVAGTILYLAFYAFHLLDRVKYYGMLDRSIKQNLTSLGQTGQAVLWE